MACLTYSLQNGVTSRWHAEYLRPGRGGKRLVYIRAMAALSRESSGDSIGRLDVLQHAEIGTASTLYSLFGRKAPHSLRNRHDGELRELQPIGDVVDGLLSETKVHSYGPCRSGWLTALHRVGDESPSFAAAALVRVLAMWASDNPHLAGRGGELPPVSAVEDLIVVTSRPEWASECQRILREVVRLAVDPASFSPLAVLGAVHDDLVYLAGRPSGRSVADELLDDASSVLNRLEYLARRLPPQQRSRLVETVTPRMARVMELLEATQ